MLYYTVLKKISDSRLFVSYIFLIGSRRYNLSTQNLLKSINIDPLKGNLPIISCNSLLEYCYQLWNQWKAKDIQGIEAIQRTFTYKITEVQHLNYWERPHELKLYSIQRRPERYIIIYIWKITQHMVSNTDGTMRNEIKTRKHTRHGTQCVIQYPTQRNPAQSLQENTITVFGPRLYNSLPKYLRDIESVKT